MRRSTRARRSSGNARSKRLLAVVGTLAVFGGIVAVTQISSAQDRRSYTRTAAASCVAPSPGATSPGGQGSTTRTWQNGRWVRNHWGDGQMSVAECQAVKAGGGAAAGTPTVACPDVRSKLPQIPDQARAEVDRNLALLDAQIAEANRRLAADGGRSGQDFINNAVLQPLADKRTAALNRIATAIDRVAQRPEGLDQFAECALADAGQNAGGNDNAGDDGGQNNDGDDNGGQNDNGDNDNGDNDNGGNDNGGNNGNGLGVLAKDCGNSQLQPHDGFQAGNRCVSTAFGEVGAAANNPSLLITQFPNRVARNQPFNLRVTTRNLVRDRFLAAGQGGYYLETSLLNEQGLVRGHFHTACRMLDSTRQPPEPQDVPAFFVATEDGRGGAQPDDVIIQIPGLPESGIAQCAVWAGDGSHRIPMMERANQTPAIDVVRIRVS